MDPPPYSGPSHSPIVIAVMGTTGVGKSTFISYATGQDAKVGNGLESCTSEVQTYEIPGLNVSLIDTPGFDDTYKNDADILKQIADCLEDHFNDQIKVSGVLYIHAITEARMKGSAMKNLMLFQKVIGEKNMSSCVLVTTKWSQQTQEKSIAHEQSLMTNKNFWKPLLDRGAKMARFADSRDAAIEIILPLIGKNGFVPQITKEYTIDRCALEDTAAGKEVNREILEAQKQHRKEVQELLNDHREALENKDLEMADMIQEERKKLQSELEDMKEQQRVLSKKREDDLEEWNRQLENEKTQSKRRAKAGWNRAGRWAARVTVGTAAVGFSVITGGFGAPAAAFVYGGVEAALQEQREKDKALFK